MRIGDTPKRLVQRSKTQMTRYLVAQCETACLRYSLSQSRITRQLIKLCQERYWHLQISNSWRDVDHCTIACIQEGALSMSGLYDGQAVHKFVHIPSKDSSSICNFESTQILYLGIGQSSYYIWLSRIIACIVVKYLAYIMCTIGMLSIFNAFYLFIK